MGKIYDALEKANLVKVPPLHHKKEPKPAPVSASGSEKVIALKAPLNNEPIGEIDSRLVSFHDPQSREAEIFKQLRTSLLFPAEGKPPRTILVTSALPDEGKSFVSANLAVSIARGIEEHVLLLDCDMRNPSAHSLFGYGPVPGLSEYLTQSPQISSLLLKTSVEKLTILPGGNPPPNPTELLSSKQMAYLMQEVKTRYDDRFIIIDSPPPHLTAETSALARLVDGILLVIGFGQAPRATITELVEKLGKEKILGVILNRYETHIRPYARYAKYGKYYHKEKQG
jgi:exopolysaccharide/PEP-CTERM locus tyrosine autokinase